MIYYLQEPQDIPVLIVLGPLIANSYRGTQNTK